MQPAASIVADEQEALIQFLYMAPAGLAQTSMDGEISLVNPLFAQLLMPLSRDASLTNLFTALESVAPELRHLAAGFAEPQGMVCDGLRIQVSAGERGKSDARILSLRLLKLDTQLMAVLTDISQEVKRERMLKQSEAWLDAILTGISDYALVSLDAQGRIDDWNASIGRVTGFTSAEVLGQPYSIFYPKDSTTPERLLDRVQEAGANGWSLDEGWRMRADGTRFWGSAVIVPLRERLDPAGGPPPEVLPDDPAYCLVIRDITDKRDATETRRKASFCDALTGIANRRTFFEAAELEVERRRRLPRELSLIMLDVDNFKRVNDTFGHPAGDAVLRHLGDLLTATFRQVDLVARVGGEEFAVLLPSTDLHNAVGGAERLRRLVESQSVEVDGVHIHYTLSGGVAAMDDSVAGLDALMKRADRALYAAKAGGRNRIECGSSAVIPISAVGRRDSPQ